jgi:hypothetical protein
MPHRRFAKCFGCTPALAGAKLRHSASRRAVSKKSHDVNEPCDFRTIFRLILNDDSLSHAIRIGARVINVHTLTRIDRSCHSATGRIHDLCGSTQREADRSLSTIDYNCLASVIRRYQTDGMGRGSLCGRWLRCGRFLSLGSLCLCERQGRNHCANKSSNYWSHRVPFH